MLSTAIIDFETSDLDADRAILLVSCIKSSKKNLGMQVLRIDDTDHETWVHGHRGHDYNIVGQTAALLEEHDVIVAHNGFFFDVPFLRTRMLKWGMDRLPDIKMVDPCNILRRKFKMRSNSLANIIDHLGLKDKKTPLSFATWGEAVMNGSREAMDQIVKHCVQDVKALEGVFNAVKPYVNVVDSRGSSL